MPCRGVGGGHVPVPYPEPTKTMVRSPLIIWLHGLGDTGRGWNHLKHELRLPQAVRYAFPDAPDAPVTCNGGYVMTSWMDLETIPIGNGLPDDAKGLADSTQIIHALIDAEVAKGTASEDIVLGGFSQGGAMALLAGYSYAKRLAGVACLSGWPSLRALCWLGWRVRRRRSRCGGVSRRAAVGARGRRRQRGHAALHRPRHAGASCCPRVARCEDALFTVVARAQDGVVLPECGKDAAERHTAAGVQVTFLDYPAAHGPHPAGMAALRSWALEALKLEDDE